MAKEVSSEQSQLAAEDILADIADFGDSVQAEIRYHTGGCRTEHRPELRKRPYVYVDVAAGDWRKLALWLKKSKKVDYCSMITGIHWPDNPEATWQVVVHLMRTGVKNPGFVVKIDNSNLGQKNPRVSKKILKETRVDIESISGNEVPLEFEISMVIPDTRTPSVPSVSDIWVGADWNEKETWDLVGIDFDGHKGMRRVLLPHDSPTGYHPLQKQHKLRYHDFNEMYDDAQGFGRKPDDMGRVK